MSEWLRTLGLLQGLVSLAVGLAVAVILVAGIYHVAGWLYRKLTNRV